MKHSFFVSVGFFTAIAAAFFLERLLGVMYPSVPLPPLAIIGIAAWMPAFSLSRRLWLGGIAGFLMDTVGATPFGTWIVLVIAAALIAEGLLFMVSVRESTAGYFGVSLSLVIGMLLLLPVARAAAALL